MRRSLLLAIVLLMATSATTQAAPKVPIVTGGFAYEFAPGATTFVEIDLRGGDIPRGSISYSSTVYPPFWGDVDCLTVVGSDAWISGVITAGTLPEGYGGWALRLHDGGTPGAEGDQAIVLYDVPEVVDAFCEEAWPDADTWMLPVERGNLVVHSAA